MRINSGIIVGFVAIIHLAGCSQVGLRKEASSATRLLDNYDRNRCAITNQGDPIRPQVSIVSPVATLSGHTAFITKVLFLQRQGLPYLLSTSWDQTIRFWDLTEMRQIWQVNIPDEKQQTVALSPDGRFALVGGQSNRIRLVELNTGVISSQEYLLPDGVWPNAIEFIPNSDSFLVGGSDTNIHVIEFGTGRTSALLTGMDWPITQVAYSSQRDFVLGSSKNAIGVWNLSTGELINRLVDTGVSDGESFWVESMQFSPRLDYIIAGSTRMIVIMDTVTGEVVQRFVGHVKPIQGAFITEDYCRIVSVSHDTSVRVWDVKTGQEISALLQLPFQFPTSSTRDNTGRQFFMAMTSFFSPNASIKMFQFED